MGSKLLKIAENYNIDKEKSRQKDKLFYSCELR